jgi:nucleotide-binding universal stress UspA family protein
MFQNILVPLDGSELAECALTYVESIVAGGKVKKVILVRVVEPVHLPGYMGSDSGDLFTEKDAKEAEKKIEAAAQGEAKSYLDELVDRLQFDNVTVQKDVIGGKTAESLIDYAEKHKIDLIALATHGRSGISRWMMGSTASRVLRLSKVPILMIRASDHDNTCEPPGAIKKILLPLDGSRAGDAAIPHAKSLANSLNAELVLIHVLEEGAIAEMPSAAMMERKDILKTSMSNYLNKKMESFKEEGLQASVMIEGGFGSAANHIIDFAEANDVGLIAMSTHGRSGIGRWIFGSVTDKVLHAGHTALLVVRAPGT